MKNIFKILFIIIYISTAANAAVADSFTSLNEVASSTQEDVYDLFRQLKEMNIIPEDFNLSSPVIAQNGQILLQLLDFIQQNPALTTAENKDYLQAFIQKLELL
jgi:hypothetical protein